jgi:hypothetical protein
VRRVVPVQVEFEKAKFEKQVFHSKKHFSTLGSRVETRRFQAHGSNLYSPTACVRANPSHMFLNSRARDSSSRRNSSVCRPWT